MGAIIARENALGYGVRWAGLAALEERRMAKP
jgi:hypothetical protein